MEKRLTLEFLKLMKKFYRMKVPFFGTAREHKKLYPLIKEVCKKSLLSGQSLQGKSIEILEKKIKKIHNCKYSVAVREDMPTNMATIEWIDVDICKETAKLRTY